MHDDAPWYERGACRARSAATTEDDDPFFHPEGERGAPKEQRISAAKDICATCPVLAQCRDYAMTAGETFGIWGGLSEDERAALRAGQSAGTGRWLHVEPFRFAETKVERVLQPESVLGHLNRLTDAGFSATAIARVAGVGPETVRALLVGTKKQVFRTTAEKLLSVQVREAVAA
jgi:WhiB family redox-sensing transcriptional regulator